MAVKESADWYHSLLFSIPLGSFVVRWPRNAGAILVLDNAS